MKKTSNYNLEDKIWHYLDKHHYVIYFILISFLSFVIRILLLKYPSGDYDMFLKPWFDALKSFGGLLGLGQNIGNYTPIYMTILSLLTYLPFDSLITIKLFSIIFDYVGAIYIAKIVCELIDDKEKKKLYSLIAYALYLFLPTIFLNSAYWSQSDGIYTAFVLISLYYLIKDNFMKGIIFWSLAFSFKFQAIFIFPLYVLIYISNRKIKFKYFLFIPLIVFLCSLPKVIFSKNLLVGFSVYFNQSSTYSQYLTLNLPNCYSIFLKGFDSGNPNLINTRFPEMGSIGIIVTMVIFMIIALMVYKKKIVFQKKVILDFAIWSILIATFFLPQMHERYLFMGDVLGIIYFLINKKKFYIPLVIELISLNGYMYLLFSGFAINFSLLSIVFLIILVLFTREMYLNYFQE